MSLWACPGCAGVVTGIGISSSSAPVPARFCWLRQARARWPFAPVCRPRRSAVGGSTGAGAGERQAWTSGAGRRAGPGESRISRRICGLPADPRTGSRSGGPSGTLPEGGRTGRRRGSAAGDCPGCEGRWTCHGSASADSSGESAGRSLKSRSCGPAPARAVRPRRPQLPPSGLALEQFSLNYGRFPDRVASELTEPERLHFNLNRSRPPDAG